MPEILSTAKRIRGYNTYSLTNLLFWSHGVFPRQQTDLMKEKYEKWAIFFLKGTISNDKMGC